MVFQKQIISFVTEGLSPFLWYNTLLNPTQNSLCVCVYTTIKLCLMVPYWYVLQFYLLIVISLVILLCVSSFPSPILTPVMGRKVQFNSVQFSHPVMSNSLRPHRLQNSRPPCPSPTPRTCSNSCPWSRWCHPAISSFVIPFSSCLQSFPASGSFPVSQLTTSGGQNIGASASASVTPMNIQDRVPLGLTGLISLQSKGLSRVFSKTTVEKHQFFSA